MANINKSACFSGETIMASSNFNKAPEFTFSSGRLAARKTVETLKQEYLEENETNELISKMEGIKIINEEEVNCPNMEEIISESIKSKLEEIERLAKLTERSLIWCVYVNTSAIDDNQGNDLINSLSSGDIKRFHLEGVEPSYIIELTFIGRNPAVKQQLNESFHHVNHSFSFCLQDAAVKNTVCHFNITNKVTCLNVLRTLSQLNLAPKGFEQCQDIDLFLADYAKKYYEEYYNDLEKISKIRKRRDHSPVFFNESSPTGARNENAAPPRKKLYIP